MATILKVEDNDKGTDLEVYPYSDNSGKEITIWANEGENHIDIDLDKQEVEELIEYLQKQLKRME